MYRPGWFPEFTPAQQALWDRMMSIVTRVFEHHGYQHIRTPAVEAVDVLKKWWDIIDQQVYWLYWLAQWPQDIKEYALHFDLTVPLARYILDHQQDIVFPFSRYQIQPVWRGESHKRGRYKEFRQCDIDTIWRSSTDVWQRYDIQSIIVMESAMKAVCNYFSLQINSLVKINHLWLTKSWLSSLSIQDEQQKQVLRLLDGFFKLPLESFQQSLSSLLGDEKSAYQAIIDLITTKDYSVMSWLPAYQELTTIISHLQSAWVRFEYDCCIVRGQNYYSGMVCERYDSDDMGLWSLAAWWRYDNLTAFIDPKQLFSGVGTSLGRFTTLVMEKVWGGEKVYQDHNKPNSYLVANLGFLPQSLSFINHHLFADQIISYYPTTAKLGKQFEFAEKKGITHLVLYGETEYIQWVCKIKDLATWEETTHIL